MKRKYPTRRLAIPSLLVAVAISAAPSASCSRRAPAPSAIPAAPVGAAPPAATRPAPPNATAKTSAGGTLAERLSGEATGRPHAGPPVEEVATALRHAGIAVAPPTQVLARTIGARYCAATTTSAGLALAVCEFGDDAEAERGLAYSRRTFDRFVPGRTLLRNRGTVLTLTPGAATAALAADTGRVARVFAAL